MQLKNQNVQLKKVRRAESLVKMMIYAPITRFCAVVNPAEIYSSLVVGLVGAQLQ